jgi:hypothetical protein
MSEAEANSAYDSAAAAAEEEVAEMTVATPQGTGLVKVFADREWLHRMYHRDIAALSKQLDSGLAWRRGGGRELARHVGRLDTLAKKAVEGFEGPPEARDSFMATMKASQAESRDHIKQIMMLQKQIQYHEEMIQLQLRYKQRQMLQMPGADAHWCRSEQHLRSPDLFFALHDLASSSPAPPCHPSRP